MSAIYLLVLSSQTDLRWNTVGLVGGRALSSCFQHNKTLVKLQLAGNNIPQDVLNAVGEISYFISLILPPYSAVVQNFLCG